MEIAVFENKNGGILPFYDSGRIQVLSDDNGSWQVTKEIPFDPFDLSGGTALPEIHKRMQLLVQDLDMCRVFVAPEIRGIPFAILDSEGFSIWKLEGDPIKLYDHIKKTMEERLSEQTSCISLKCGNSKSCETSCGEENFDRQIPQPVAINEDGEYSIDLAKILDSNQSFNSREILIPFIQTASFKKLSIICEHVPKWLSRDYELFNLTLHSESTSEGLCLVTVSPDGSGVISSRHGSRSHSSCCGS